MHPYAIRLLLLLLMVAPVQPVTAGPWYTEDQVARGKVVFQENCAACHGVNAEAKPDWRMVGADGKYPPPPLNGTGHAWHHPLEILRRQIRFGGLKSGGAMPAFGDKLKDQDIDAAIAYFQSKWPDNIYQTWLARNGDTGLKPVKSGPAEKENVTTHWLKQRLKGASIGQPAQTPVNGIFQARVGSDYVYLTEDGQVVFWSSDETEYSSNYNIYIYQSGQLACC